MMRFASRLITKFGMIGAGLCLLLSAGTAWAQASVESLPLQPFSSEAGSSRVQNEQLGQIFSSDNMEFVPADTNSAPNSHKPQQSQSASAQKKDTTSLWDTVGQFFDLGASGDPNHLTKLRYTAGISTGYDSNVLTSNVDPIASPTAGINGTMAYNFGSDRLKLTSALSGGATHYTDRPGNKTDYNGTFAFSGSYYLTRRLQITGALAVSYLSQPSPLVVGGQTHFQGDYAVFNGQLGVNYSLRPRLSLQLGYEGSGIHYAESDINQQSGYRQQTFTLGLSYLLTPRFTLTTNYQFVPITYNISSMDSIGNILTVGFVTAFTQKFKWTLRAGAENRDLQNPSPGAVNNYFGPFLETNVEYDISPGSSLVGSIRYGTEPSGLSGVSISQTLRGSLDFNYSFAGRLSCALGVAYEHDHYDSPGTVNDFSQAFYSGYIGLRYQFNPALALTARYEYTSLSSQISLNNYTRDVSTLGLELNF